MPVITMKALITVILFGAAKAVLIVSRLLIVGFVILLLILIIAMALCTQKIVITAPNVFFVRIVKAVRIVLVV